MGNRRREGVCWMCAPAPSLLSPIYALQGDTGWGFQGDCLGLVMDLQVGGMLYVIFSPSAAPYTIRSLPLLSFQVTQSLHCTQGVVITGAAEIGQDKGTLPAQDVFPLSFLFSSTSSFPSPFLFSLLVSCPLILSFTHICCTLFTYVSSILAHFLSFTSCSLSKQSVLKWKNKSHMPPHRVCPLP